MQQQGPPALCYSTSTGMGFTCPPTSTICFLRASAGGRGGGLLGGCLMVSPIWGRSRGFCSMGRHSSPRTAACRAGRGQGAVSGETLSFNPITTPCSPRAAHQQVDATGNAQTDSAQDGGKQEASRDGQPESTREGEGGGSGCAPHPQPHSRCMQDGTDVVTPGERSKHLQHCRHVPLATVG